MTISGAVPPAARCVAVIPARGGSKGIRGKNLARVGGKALVVRAVEAARRARRVDLVVVSTDDQEIADVASASGAVVVHRPGALASDTASSEAALVHALDSLAEAGLEPEVLVFVQCTAPFVTATDVDEVVAAIDAGADSALSAVPSHGFLWKRGPHGAIGVNHDPAGRRRRQDLEPEYLENGAVYGMRVGGFRAAGHRFFGRVEIVETDRARALEIDEPSDLAAARAIATHLDPSAHAPAIPPDAAALVMDFDGVLTDDTVLTMQDGSEGVVASRRDGLGLERLRSATSLTVAVISKERNPVVAARCAKLDIECIQGIDSKLGVLQAWCAERGLILDQVVYVGNDVNDIECMEAAGCGVAVADAWPEVRARADIVLSAPGGRGAVRELTEVLIERLGYPTPADGPSRSREGSSEEEGG